jgi:hypothetical protein
LEVEYRVVLSASVVWLLHHRYRLPPLDHVQPKGVDGSTVMRLGMADSTLNGPALKLPLVHVADAVMPKSWPGATYAAGRDVPVIVVEVPAVIAFAPML